MACNLVQPAAVAFQNRNVGKKIGISKPRRLIELFRLQATMAHLGLAD